MNLWPFLFFLCTKRSRYTSWCTFYWKIYTSPSHTNSLASLLILWKGTKSWKLLNLVKQLKCIPTLLLGVHSCVSTCAIPATKFLFPALFLLGLKGGNNFVIILMLMMDFTLVKTVVTIHTIFIPCRSIAKFWQYLQLFVKSVPFSGKFDFCLHPSLPKSQSLWKILGIISTLCLDLFSEHLFILLFHTLMLGFRQMTSLVRY